MTLNEGLDPEVPFSPTQEVDVVDDSEASYLHDTRVSGLLEQTPPMPPNWTQDLIKCSTATPRTTQPSFPSVTLMLRFPHLIMSTCSDESLLLGLRRCCSFCDPSVAAGGRLIAMQIGFSRPIPRRHAGPNLNPVITMSADGRHRRRHCPRGRADRVHGGQDNVRPSIRPGPPTLYAPWTWRGESGIAAWTVDGRDPEAVSLVAISRKVPENRVSRRRI